MKHLGVALVAMATVWSVVGASTCNNVAVTVRNVPRRTKVEATDRRAGC